MNIDCSRDWEQECHSLETQVQILKQEIIDLHGKKTFIQKDKLVAFLYLLMRDAAPTGEIVRAIRMVKSVDHAETCYTSKELQAYAERLASELIEE